MIKPLAVCLGCGFLSVTGVLASSSRDLSRGPAPGVLQFYPLVKMYHEPLRLHMHPFSTCSFMQKSKQEKPKKTQKSHLL